MIYDNVMWDIETLGVLPGAKIFSIGMVAFNLGGLGPKVKILVNPDAQVGGQEPSTVQWWAKQSDEARSALTAAYTNGFPSGVAVAKVNEFFRQTGMASVSKVKVWGNGADFDNVLMRDFIDRHVDFGHHLKADNIWKFWNNRCLRTLRSLAPSVPKTKPAVAHDSLSDAEAQAIDAVTILNKLKVA